MGPRLSFPLSLRIPLSFSLSSRSLRISHSHSLSLSLLRSPLSLSLFYNAFHHVLFPMTGQLAERPCCLAMSDQGKPSNSQPSQSNSQRVSQINELGSRTAFRYSLLFSPLSLSLSLSCSLLLSLALSLTFLSLSLSLVSPSTSSSLSLPVVPALSFLNFLICDI